MLFADSGAVLPGQTRVQTTVAIILHIKAVRNICLANFLCLTTRQTLNQPFTYLLTERKRAGVASRLPSVGWEEGFSCRRSYLAS